MSELQATTPAATPAMQAWQDKRARRARWTRIGGWVIGGAFALRVLAHVLHPAAAPAAGAGAAGATGTTAAAGSIPAGTVPACDNATITASVTEMLTGSIAVKHLPVTVAGIAEAHALGEGTAPRRCAASVTFAQGGQTSTNTVRYHVDTDDVALDGVD